MDNKFIIDEIGRVDYTNFPLYDELKKICEKDNKDLFALKTCGNHCGDGNCS